jgi:integral membrane sensor domain MASE1
LASGLFLLLASAIFAIAPLAGAHDADGFSIAGIVFSFVGLLMLLFAGTRFASQEQEQEK